MWTGKGQMLAYTLVYSPRNSWSKRKWDMMGKGQPGSAWRKEKYM